MRTDFSMEFLNDHSPNNFNNHLPTGPTHYIPSHSNNNNNNNNNNQNSNYHYYHRRPRYFHRSEAPSRFRYPAEHLLTKISSLQKPRNENSSHSYSQGKFKSGSSATTHRRTGQSAVTPLTLESYSLDIFGCIPYNRIFISEENTSGALPTTTTTTEGGGKYSDNNNTNIGEENKKKYISSSKSLPPELDIPWHLREAFSDPGCSYFDFLGTKHFWFLIQYAARVSLVGMLVPAAFITATEPSVPFFGTVYTLSAVIIGAGTSVGRAANFLTQFLKAACIWLPISTICAAIELHRTLIGLLFVYVIVLFLMASLVDGVARRMSLLLFTVTLVGQLVGRSELTFASKVLVDWLIGVLFAFAATLVPYPLLSTRIARSTTRRVYRNAATAFRGLTTCFWSISNTERSMRMVRIRRVTKSLDILLDALDEVEVFTFYEFFFFDSYEKREIRIQKAELMDKLRLNLRSMTRVINIVQDRPHIIDNSDRCIKFGTSLSRPMESISRAVEELFNGLSHAQGRKELLELSSLFEDCGRTIKKLQEEFADASRVLFYEKDTSEQMEEFVPLMTFFVFSVVNFWSALDDFHKSMRLEESSLKYSSLRRIWDGISTPFIENYKFLKRLFTIHGEAELRVIIEAGKVSIAMLIALLFFYYVQPQSLLLSGPTIIAFLSGMNPVEAVQASVSRLTGTLLGSVLGFFAVSLSNTEVDLIASICTLTAVLTFFRTGQKYGIVCMYANFVALSSLSLRPRSNAEMVISRIQQNSFAVMIYCFICVIIFPVSPGKLLMRKRIEILQGVSRSVGSMMNFYGEPLSNDKRNDNHFIFKGNWMMDGNNGIHNVDASSDHNNNNNNNNNNSNNDYYSSKDKDNMGLIYTHPQTFIAVPEPDPRIRELFKEVELLKKEMRFTTSIMPFAADERGIAPMIYPRSACEALQTALYRIFALVYTMTCSWKLMCDKGYFTHEVRRIMFYLYPIATDIRFSLQRFVNILSFYVEHPSSSLAPELAKCLMQFRALVDELAGREHRAMIKVIADAVARQRGRRRERARTLNPLERNNIHNNNIHIHNNNNNNNNNNISLQQTYLETGVVPVFYTGNNENIHRNNNNNNNNNCVRHQKQHRRSSPIASDVEIGMSNTDEIMQPALPTHNNNNKNKDDEAVFHAGEILKTQKQQREEKEEEEDNNDGNIKNNNINISDSKKAKDIFMTGAPLVSLLPPVSKSKQKRRSSSTGSLHFPHSDENSSMIFSSHSSSADSSASSSAGSVHFSDSFTTPITVHDAEGLHSITLALEMMGKELKNALLAFEEMVQVKEH